MSPPKKSNTKTSLKSSSVVPQPSSSSSKKTKHDIAARHAAEQAAAAAADAAAARQRAEAEARQERRAAAAATAAATANHDGHRRSERERRASERLLQSRESEGDEEEDEEEEEDEGDAAVPDDDAPSRVGHVPHPKHRGRIKYPNQHLMLPIAGQTGPPSMEATATAPPVFPATPGTSARREDGTVIPSGRQLLNNISSATCAVCGEEGIPAILVAEHYLTCAARVLVAKGEGHHFLDLCRRQLTQVEEETGLLGKRSVEWYLRHQTGKCCIFCEQTSEDVRRSVSVMIRCDDPDGTRFWAFCHVNELRESFSADMESVYRLLFDTTASRAREDRPSIFKCAACQTPCAGLVCITNPKHPRVRWPVCSWKCIRSFFRRQKGTSQSGWPRRLRDAEQYIDLAVASAAANTSSSAAPPASSAAAAVSSSFD